MYEVQNLNQTTLCLKLVFAASLSLSVVMTTQL
jgi:hypothetical protein